MSEDRSEYTVDPQPDVVPIYNRADITPHDLAVLRRKITELEGRVKQADGECACQEEIIRYLFRELGFQFGAFTLSGARDMIGQLTRLVDGHLSIADFGEPIEGEQDTLIYHLIARISR
jgi:hypothetical protein